MIDAKEGFEKDGAKNRLREMDIRRIEDVWEAHEDVPHYARFVSFEEIERNGYNLNIPRYVTPEDTEILQDITAHLHGGLPRHDVDEVLASYWNACPSLRDALFSLQANGYYNLKVNVDNIIETIDGNDSYQARSNEYLKGISLFFDEVTPQMEVLSIGFNPKDVIAQWGQRLLEATENQQLVNPYNVYEILMNYWNEVMQDDCYMVSRDGWRVTYDFTKAKNPTFEDMICDLLPIDIVVHKFFENEYKDIIQVRSEIEQLQAQADQLAEDNPEAFADFFEEGKFSEAIVKKEVAAFKKGNSEGTDDMNTLWKQYLSIYAEKKEKANSEKILVVSLTKQVIAKYDALIEDEVRLLVIYDKWKATIMQHAEAELDRVNQQMRTDVLALVDRYAHTLPEIENRVNELRDKVNAHLASMGI